MGTLLYAPKISNVGFLEEKKNREEKENERMMKVIEMMILNHDRLT